MKRLYLLPLALGLLASQASQAATACPSPKFPAFFAAYADNVAVQKAYTVYPLTHVLLDHATVQPREIKVLLPKAKLSFPLIPSRAERKRAGLTLRTDQVDETFAKVSLVKEDTGYEVVYIFRKDACWTLERKEDRSL